MLPRLGSSKLVSTWIWVTLAASVVAIFDGGWISHLTGLAPMLIWRGQVWRLATWVFVAPGPYALVVTCLCIYKFGGELAYRWGDRRLRRFMVEVMVGAALATTLLALISRDAWQLHGFGSWAVGDALVIAWARQFPSSPLSLWGLVTLNGQRLIAIVVAITCIYALFAGPLRWAPELLVCAAAYWYPKRRLAA
jgi:hypothetical protein